MDRPRAGSLKGGAVPINNNKSSYSRLRRLPRTDTIGRRLESASVNSAQAMIRRPQPVLAVSPHKVRSFHLSCTFVKLKEGCRRDRSFVASGGKNAASQIQALDPTSRGHLELTEPISPDFSRGDTSKCKEKLGKSRLIVAR